MYLILVELNFVQKSCVLFVWWLYYIWNIKMKDYIKQKILKLIISKHNMVEFKTIIIFRVMKWTYKLLLFIVHDHFFQSAVLNGVFWLHVI